MLGLAIGSILTGNAQMTSFETSEGFVVGPLSGQNGWGASAAQPGSAAVSNLYAAGEGTNSLAIIGLAGTAHGFVGAFSPVVVHEGDVVTVEYDVYFTSVSATSSDFRVGVQSPSQLLITSAFQYSYLGEVKVYANDPADPESALALVTTTATFEPGQWYHCAIQHNFADGTIQYYFNGNLVHTSGVFGGTNVEQLTFLNDNYNSSAYFDNISITNGPLSVSDRAVSQLAVYPNPINDIVNIDNPDNAVLESVKITDINGRIIKTVGNKVLTSGQIDVSDLSNGVYMMTISTDKGAVTKKIVKN